MTIEDLVPDVCGRTEEDAPGVNNGPIFWNLVGEIRPQIVDAMFEATLVTGVVQSVNQSITLAAGTTYFSIPKGSFAALRMRAPYPIRKVSLKGLDDMIPAWQNTPARSQIAAWFPLGVSGFGIFPQLTAEANVIMDFICSPVNVPRPYSGNETVPFQSEFADAFSQYAAAMLRCKEGGAEAEEASVVYQEYMEGMKALSAFQGRVDSLIFSAAWGGKLQTNPRSTV